VKYKYIHLIILKYSYIYINEYLKCQIQMYLKSGFNRELFYSTDVTFCQLC